MYFVDRTTVCLWLFEEWFEDRDFGRWCMVLYEKSDIRKQGLVDDDYFKPMLQGQLDEEGAVMVFMPG